MDKQCSSELIYKGKVVTLHKDEILCENGVHAIREVVSAPGGVAILAIQDQEILLVSQYRYAVQEETLEIPAGTIEPHEELSRCALRELEEETGYTSDTMNKIFTFFPTPGFCAEVLHIFEAGKLTHLDHPKAMDEDECITAFFLPIEEAMDLVRQGKIKDSKTIIAIQYAAMKYAHTTMK